MKTRTYDADTPDALRAEKRRTEARRSASALVDRMMATAPASEESEEPAEPDRPTWLDKAVAAADGDEEVALLALTMELAGRITAQSTLGRAYVAD